jgi:hypothetical protein
MIVALAEQASARLKTLDQRERSRSQAQALGATRQALAGQLRPEVTTLATTYQILASRVTPAALADVQEQAAKAAQDLRSSRVAFATQPKQDAAISKIKDAVARASTSLTDVWKQYAGSQLVAPIELLNMLYRLPELQGQASALDALRADLIARSQRVPRTEADLEKFEDVLRDLGGRMAGVRGLSESVRDFLHKAVAGTATVADLTDEVLAWCRKGDHAKTFHISF